MEFTDHTVTPAHRILIFLPLLDIPYVQNVPIVSPLYQNFNWKLYISSPVKSASVWLNVLHCLCRFFLHTAANNSIQGPCLPLSQVWGGFHSHTDSLPSIKPHRNVASFSIFWYFHTNCSSELANCPPPLLLQPPCTRL